MQTSGRDNRVPAQLRAGIAALLVLTAAKRKHTEE
jgi:hypothetical protein